MNCPELSAIKRAARGHEPNAIGEWLNYSVLLPLVERGGELYVLYELRSPDLSVQPNEISFPGGGVNEGENARAAALRETVEELGIRREAIEVVSELDYLIHYANLRVFCFLGVIDAKALEQAVVNKAEVADYFLLPLKWLLASSPEVYFITLEPVPAPDFPIARLSGGDHYKWRKGKSDSPVYVWVDTETGTERIIWGMTARLTMAFVDLLKGF